MAIRLEVWGDYALFTRPEMKVERVSYDVMTPSAARGILEAIYWHPGMRWVIDSIQVCQPIRFTNIRRNEVASKASTNNMRTAMKRGKMIPYLDTSKEIQQRASLLLRNVRYVITAHFDMTEKVVEGDNPGKFQDIIKRRVNKGQYYHQPYFGCREFPVYFQEAEKEYPCVEELRGEKDLGFMLYDLDYSDPENIRPMFFRAIMRDGVITVPSVTSEEVVS